MCSWKNSKINLTIPISLKTILKLMIESLFGFKVVSFLKLSTRFSKEIFDVHDSFINYIFLVLFQVGSQLFHEQ
jgi:hypothetical protein